MTFAHAPLVLLSAIVFAAAFFAQRLGYARFCRRAFAYSNLAFMTSALRAPRWPVVLCDLALAGAWSLLVAASAGPRVWLPAPAVPTIVITLDTSGSMSARDVRPSRARAAASVVRSLVNAAPPGARIGLVSFAGTAQRIVAPTVNREAVLAGLARVPAPNGQTAIGDGLAAAAAMLPGIGSRAILLITDGVNNRGEDPRAIIRRLAALRIGFDRIAIGSRRSIRAQMESIAARDFTARTPRDVTPAFVAAALCLGAAAWLASAGAAPR